MNRELILRRRINRLTWLFIVGLALSGATFLREHVRRGVSAPGGQHAVVVPCFRFANPLIDIRAGFEPEQQRPLAERSFVIPLRI